MTKERLKRLRALIKEAEHLKAMLLAPPSTNQYVVDYANDYHSGHPIPFTIAGYGQNDYAEIRQRWYEKLRTIQTEIRELEDWLDEVEEPQLRDILRLQHINGLTQEQIAEEIGYSVITIKRRLKKFWKDDTE